MENTTLASTQHTSGCWKNGSPLMWWLHGFSLKFSFRKKNVLFRWILNLFHPCFLEILNYMISFVFFSKGTSTKIITSVMWTLPQLFFFYVTTLWLFLFKPWERVRVVILVAAAGSIERSDVRFLCIHLYTCAYCVCVCVFAFIGKRFLWHQIFY